MSHIPISKKFEVGDLVRYTIVEEQTDPPLIFLLLEQPDVEANPISPFAKHRWKVMNVSNGEIHVTYINTDFFEIVN